MTAKREIPNTDDIINAYLTGESLAKILKDNAISECLFTRLLRDRGIKRRSREEYQAFFKGKTREPRTQVNEVEIAQAYISGESIKAIEKRIGVSWNVVTRCLRNQNIVRRTRSEAESLKWQTIKQSPELVERQLGAAWKVANAKDDELERIVIASYQAGKSAVEIANENNCSVGNVKRITSKNGIGDIEFKNARRAKGVQFSGSGKMISQFEMPLFDSFKSFGLEPVHQYAIESCNVDFAFPQVRVIVELERRYINDSKSITRERIENIIRSGWRILIIYNPRKHDIAYADVAQQTVAFLDSIRANPAIVGHYGVIGSDGKPHPRFSDNLYDFTRIEGF